MSEPITTLPPSIILVVDDEKDLRDGLKIDLEGFGYKVLTAADGAEALDIMERDGQHIQLILSDEMMPVFSGFKLCESVKANPIWVSIPFVFLTARSEESEFVEGFRLGASDYVVKPYRRDKLLAVLEKRIADYQGVLSYQAGVLENARLTSIEQMARGVVHDLSSVLTELGFGGEVQECLKDLRKLESVSQEPATEKLLNQMDQYCQELKQAIEMGVSLLDGLQSICRGHGDKKELQMLGDIVQGPLNLLQKSISQHGIAVECQFEDVLIECCKRDFTQVALNLIRNAIAAMDSSAKRQLTLRIWEEAEQAHFSVKDTGCGISPEQLERIFEWGFTTKDTGKGVGMPTVKRILESYKGEISVESSSSGTIIVATLPAYTESI